MLRSRRLCDPATTSPPTHSPKTHSHGHRRSQKPETRRGLATTLTSVWPSWLATYAHEAPSYMCTIRRRSAAGERQRQQQPHTTVTCCCCQYSTVHTLLRMAKSAFMFSMYLTTSSRPPSHAMYNGVVPSYAPRAQHNNTHSVRTQDRFH